MEEIGDRMWECGEMGGASLKNRHLRSSHTDVRLLVPATVIIPRRLFHFVVITFISISIRHDLDYTTAVSAFVCINIRIVANACMSSLD